MGSYHGQRTKTDFDLTPYSTWKTKALVAYMVRPRDPEARLQDAHSGELTLDAITYKELTRLGFTRAEIEKSVNRLAGINAVALCHACDGTPLLLLMSTESEIDYELYNEDHGLPRGRLEEK
jgi:hypothetical protein